LCAVAFLAIKWSNMTDFKWKSTMICTKFVQSTLRKIFTVVATRYFGWALPQPPLGKLIVLPQTTYLDLRGPTFKEREGRKYGGKEKKEEGQERMCAVGIFNYFRLWKRGFI